jgi:hypothetical protein
MVLPAADPGKAAAARCRRRLGRHRDRTVPGLPGLAATVFDLPHVTGFAARMIAAAELSGRITAAAGGLFASGKYPAGHDIAQLSGGQEPAGGVSMLG